MNTTRDGLMFEWKEPETSDAHGGKNKSASEETK